MSDETIKSLTERCQERLDRIHQLETALRACMEALENLKNNHRSSIQGVSALAAAKAALNPKQ